jgi:hypothetical protein
MSSERRNFRDYYSNKKRRGPTLSAERQNPPRERTAYADQDISKDHSSFLIGTPGNQAYFVLNFLFDNYQRENNDHRDEEFDLMSYQNPSYDVSKRTPLREELQDINYKYDNYGSGGMSSAAANASPEEMEVIIMNLHSKMKNLENKYIGKGISNPSRPC